MRKILVCQTGGWIGDMVLLTPALRALKQAYPEAAVSLLLRHRVAALMETHPYLDTCIVDTKTAPNRKRAENRKRAGRWHAMARLVRQIQAHRFDAAVVLHPTSFRNALLPFLAQVPVRIGTRVGGRGVLLTDAIQEDTQVHEVKRYLRVLRLLGIEGGADALTFWHTDADRRAVADLLQAEGVEVSTRLIAVNLGTTWRTKRWEVPRFAAVVRALSAVDGGAQVLLTGSPAELELTAQLPAGLPAINLVGRTSVLELGALLERCAVCLTCDSGPMHIAAAVGTPTVALFGPTAPVRHAPYGVGHLVVEKSVSCRPCYKPMCRLRESPHLCMTEIGASEVVAAVAAQLRKVRD